jgi:hypothetical protein
MKRLAIIVLVVASSACGAMNKGGARGPTIQRTNDTAQTASDPSTGSVDVRAELAR